MKLLPKKYKPQDLRERSNLYNQKLSQANNNTDYTYSTSILPISEKILYNDFFLLYLRDFFSCKKNLENSRNNNKESIHEQLFITSNNQFKNMGTNFEFFNKKNQTLSQVGVNKLERRTVSINKKKLNINNKIIDSYLSSPHKLFLYDSDLYLYIINQFHSLWDKGKITNQTKICYRSFDLQTSIPEQHITWKEEKIQYHVLKYFIGAKCEALPVCVDDIDSCCGDVGLLVHPKDKRYNKYIGKNAIIPLCNRQIPIIGDENINIMQNNGIKRICPFADQEGIELAKKYGLPTDIYVFDQKGLYTDYIHEPAFIGQERSKYYDNIEGFIQDIGNLSEKGEKIAKIPYFNYTNERLIPYKMDQIVVDLKEEKEEILNQVINQTLHFSFIDQKYGNTFSEIEELEAKLEKLKDENISVEDNDEDIQQENMDNLGNKISKTEEKIAELKKSITDEIEPYLPDSFTCSCQIPYSWKLPLIKNSDGLSFFDIEKDCSKWREKPLQTCFDFALLSLVRIGAIGLKTFGDNTENKLCEYDKIFSILSQNEKKIHYFVKQLRDITGDKKEYEKFINIIQNLTDEVNPTIGDCKKLIENSKFLHQNGNRLILDIDGIYSNSFNPDFVQLCIPCYLYDKNIKTENEVLMENNDKHRIFQELLIQKLILGEPISNNYLEYTYNYDNEFLGDKQLTKTQLEQSQWDLFSLYGENPIRLSFLINEAYDQKQILLNSIFLKQIWNAIRLCIQKNFLPDDIAKTLDNQPEEFDDFDLLVLSKLNNLYDDWKNVESFDQYIRFFNHLKSSIQDIFFSRYIEIQKTNPTKNIHFVCTYFFNFLLTALYPLIPEYVNALCYMSGKDFKQPIKPVTINRATDYNMNIFYDTFIRIKNIKLDLNIKQHENCNLFIKSSPSLGEMFEKYEQIFKSYFHVSEISYLRLHEPNLLGYEVFSDDIVTIGIQAEAARSPNEEESLENIERDIKNLEDKLNLLRQRIQFLPEGEQREKAEKEYSETKEKMENLTIRHSLLSSK